MTPKEAYEALRKQRPVIAARIEQEHEKHGRVNSNRFFDRSDSEELIELIGMTCDYFEDGEDGVDK